MNTFNKMFLILTALVLMALSASAQTILSTTTLGAAITTTNGTAVTLASTSTMLSQGSANQVNTALVVDQEYMTVTTVVDTTHVVVKRGVGVGYGGRPVMHKSGATVWFANTIGNTPAPSYFVSNSAAENWGQCTASTLLVLPRINTYWGTKADCLGVGTAGQWTQTDRPGLEVLGATYTMPAGVATLPGTIFLTDSGTNATTGINVPNGAGPGFSVTIIPGGAFTTTTATNIRLASTAVVGKALILTWDGSKWDPSY